MLQHELDEMSDKCRPQDKVWTKSTLRYGGVRPIPDARRMFEEHPLLEWTEMHERVSSTDLGWSRLAADAPPRRSEADPPDGRIASPPAEFMKLLPKKVIKTPRGASSPAAEVFFEGIRHKEPLVLWYPKAALERVQLPRGL